MKVDGWAVTVGTYMGLVSTNGSIPGLDGGISADPITLPKVTSKSVDNSCIMAWVSNIWVSVT